MKRKILAGILSFCMAAGSLPGVGLPIVYAGGPATERALEDTVRKVLNFNTDWKYKKGDVTNGGKEELADEKWCYVNLPHATTFYTAENKDAYLGISWYRKHFTVDETLRKKKLLLTFEAAMQQADVYLNGTLVHSHQGGYIPFVLDLTEKVRYGQENVIAVKTDSRANSSFAPGKEVPDFQYFGGIYGNAYLTVTDSVHITDAVEAAVTAGGGVFVTAGEVSEEEAKVRAKTHIENEEASQKEVTLVTELVDEDGSVKVSQTDRKMLAAGAAETFVQTLTVENPRLWSPDTPELYTVRSTVKVGNEICDTQETACGIRKVEWKRDGLYINDKKFDVNGANLHAETYMLGNAMPDNAIYEEVKRFKENGFDMMRMSHYPHRQAYYDACDKYGVMVVECASGWQYFQNTDDFKNSTYQELRTDIRHNRNHPCIVAWETSLNESNYTRQWAEEMNRIAKEEYPADGCAYAWTAGCSQWPVWDIGLGTPQAAIFKDGAAGAENAAYAQKPVIIAEYGDWNYGGTYSTTRVTREAQNDFWGKGGDEGMLIQADNIQEAVQTNRKNGAKWLGASMYWDYADYAGFDQGILTYCGVVDLCRIPKHGAYFYRSQRSADLDLSEYGIESGAMVYIANTWDGTETDEVRIFSNCDTVELFLNGKSLGEKGHDTTIFGPHGDVDPVNHPNGQGKEIAADALSYAPITFDIPNYEAGELRAVGRIDGKEEAEHVRKTPQRAVGVALRPESDAPIPLDGSSAKLVWIDLVDANGTVDTSAYKEVDLEVAGPGLIVGPKTVTTKGGQLAVWVRSRRGSGAITLRASADGLRQAELVLPVEEVSGLLETPKGGDADEYEFAEEENVFLNKAARASTENRAGTANAEAKELANDGNENTKWCASSGSYPQWWEVDLGSECTIETMEMSFETPGSVYYYTVAVADEPMTDDTYRQHIVTDRSAGSAETAIDFAGEVKGRYVRITFTQASGGEWAVLREVSGTGKMKNIALGKPVSASTTNGQESPEYAVDGREDTKWCAVGGEGTLGHWLQIDLKDTYRVTDAAVLFEMADAQYRFVLQGSIDGKHFRDIKDFRDGAGCGQRAEISMDEVVKFLRIYDISTKDPASQWPCIKEIEVFGEKTEYQLDNMSREKEASASSCRAGSAAAHGNNGVPNWYWYPQGTGEAWWCVDMKGIYDLDHIQMTWNEEEEHRYRIDFSVDGKTWTTAVDRTKEGSREVQPYELVRGKARYVRVTLPKGHGANQGFGLFSVYAKESEAVKGSKVLPLAVMEVQEGTSFWALHLPEEVEVQCEDGILMKLPVSWNENDYNGNVPGVYDIGGVAEEIPGLTMDAGQKAKVTVRVTKKPEEQRPNPVKPVPALHKVYEGKDGLRFKVTKSAASGGRVCVVKAKNKAKVVIPKQVTLDGYSFQVTEIAANAFKGCKSLKAVTIGEKVAKIGKKAFFKCKKLKTVAFQNTKAPQIGTQAFKGIAAKGKVLAPKKMTKKAFKTLKMRMKKAGAGKKTVYKKK